MRPVLLASYCPCLLTPVLLASCPPYLLSSLPPVLLASLTSVMFCCSDLLHIKVSLTILGTWPDLHWRKSHNKQGCGDVGRYHLIVQHKTLHVVVLESLERWRQSSLVLGIAPLVLGLAFLVMGLAPLVLGLAHLLMRLAPLVLGLAPLVLGLAPLVLGLSPLVLGLSTLVLGLSTLVLEMVVWYRCTGRALALACFRNHVRYPCS